MVKNEVSAAGASTVKSKKKILITQPRPESDKSPYFELSRKYAVELDFHPFIKSGSYSGKRLPQAKDRHPGPIPPLFLPAAMPLIIFSHVRRNAGGGVAGNQVFLHH
jgi:hypothetical protein